MGVVWDALKTGYELDGLGCEWEEQRLRRGMKKLFVPPTAQASLSHGPAAYLEHSPSHRRDPPVPVCNFTLTCPIPAEFLAACTNFDGDCKD